MPSPSQDPLRELIHQVNNLLAVIHTQTAVARTLGTQDAACAALDHVAKAARETQELIALIRRQERREASGRE